MVISLLSQPRDFFNLPCCGRCLTQPCDQLRFGGVYPEKFILVPCTEERGDISGCPFEITHPADVQYLLSRESLLSIIRRVDDITVSLPVATLLQYRPEHCVAGYTDIAGRIQYLLRLWEHGAFRMLAVPLEYGRDKTIHVWLHAYESWVQQAEEKKKEQQAALTDDIEETPVSAVKIVNPRWEHIDEKRKEKSPGAAAPGDRIRLIVDVEGVPNGAEVVFDIYDTSTKPAFRIATVKGPNEAGTASAEWEVVGDLVKGENTIAFEASVRGKYTEKKEIPLEEVLGLWFQIDLDNPISQDDKIILEYEDGTEVETIYMKDKKEEKEDYIRLVFSKIEDGRKYNVIYDPGKEGAPYPVILGVEADVLKGKKA